MRCCLLALHLALRDWLHERTLSLCAVLALASMLTPLLVLNGVRVGFVENLRERLLQDPSALVIMPQGSGVSGYTMVQMHSFQSRPDVHFAIARTRAVAAELQFETKTGAFVAVSLEPTGEGDPLLQRHKVSAPEAALPLSQLVLSAAAAKKLGAEAGQNINARLGRKRPDGVLESIILPFVVTAVLPPEATALEAAFLSLAVLDDIQDYRDYIAVPRRNFAGDVVDQAQRYYESFRVYARSIDDVENLDAFFHAEGISVVTKAKSIADIRIMDAALTKIIFVIAVAVGLGFLAFTISSAHAAVRRKDRMLGMLRLLGFSRLALLIYPLSQIMLTGCCGCVLAGLFSLGVGLGIDGIFASVLDVSLCVLRAQHFAAVLGGVLLLSALAALRPALSAAQIDPSLVIRDV